MRFPRVPFVLLKFAWESILSCIVSPKSSSGSDLISNQGQNYVIGAMPHRNGNGIPRATFIPINLRTMFPTRWNNLPDPFLSVSFTFTIAFFHKKHSFFWFRTWKTDVRLYITCRRKEFEQYLIILGLQLVIRFCIALQKDGIICIWSATMLAQ